MSKLKYWRELNDEVPKHLHRNIVTFMYPETILTLSRVRRFARHTRDYCRGYFKLAKGGEESDSKEKIERMRKTCKAHRNIIDMEPVFFLQAAVILCAALLIYTLPEVRRRG